MYVCTFLGQESSVLDEALINNTVESLIVEGYDIFYVGNQGAFDWLVYKCLKQLRNKYPHIYIKIILAGLPGEAEIYADYPDVRCAPIAGKAHNAVARRDHWMTDLANCCVCWIDSPGGQAYRSAMRAKHRGLQIINLGSCQL